MRIRVRFPSLVLAVAFCLFAGFAKSATVEQDGPRLHLSGPIFGTTSDLFVDAFARAMLSAPREATIQVVLNSEGGDTKAAHRIADAIEAARRHGVVVETRVENGAVCLSACPLVFSAGAERKASAGAVFLFHGVVYRGWRDTAAVVAELEAEKRRYLDRMRSVDDRLGRFLDDRRIVADNIDTVFNGAGLQDAFPGFVTALITPTDTRQ